MNAARDEEPGLSLLVHQPGEEPALLHTGLASLEHGLPIGPDTIFNVGSVAKQITAHLILLSASDNLLQLGQRAADLLPRLKISDVTVADLVTHRSGIRDAESLLSSCGFRDLDHYTADDLRTLAYRQDQRAVPKDRFLYSNTNYLLLAEILETVHRTTLPDLVRHRVLGPLGMHSTRFKTDPRQVIPGAASAYQATQHGWQHTETPVTLPGPGTLWTTVGDLDRWLTHLHQHWQHPHQLPWQEAVDYEPSDHEPYLYGPGLYADARPGRTAVFHYGHEQGFSAAAHVEASGLRVIALSNNAGLSTDRVTAAILRDLHEQPMLPPRKSSSAPRPWSESRALSYEPSPYSTTATGTQRSAPSHATKPSAACSSPAAPPSTCGAEDKGPAHPDRTGRPRRQWLHPHHPQQHGSG